MKTSVLVVLVLGAILVPLAVVADSSNPSPIDKSQLHRMMRDAHTSAQYHALAAYFRVQQQHFQQQAEAEREEWARRSANISGPSAKYPRPVDSSRNRYESFTYRAQEMDRQAAHYESLSVRAN